MSVTPASLEVGNVVLSGLLTDDERFALGEAAKSFESGAGVATDLPYRAVAFTRLLFHERLLNAVAEHLGPNVQYWGSCFFRANHVGTVPSSSLSAGSPRNGTVRRTRRRADPSTSRRVRGKSPETTAA